MDLINEINISKPQAGEICIEGRHNFSIQNELVCAVGNSFSIKYYGTTYHMADVNSDEYWVDITDFLFGASAVVCNNTTVRSIAIKTGCALCKIKVVVTPTISIANNKAMVSINY